MAYIPDNTGAVDKKCKYYKEMNAYRCVYNKKEGEDKDLIDNKYVSLVFQSNDADNEDRMISPVWVRT